MGETPPGDGHSREGVGLTQLLLLPGLLCDESIWSGQMGSLRSAATATVPEYRSATSLEEMASVALGTVDGPISVAGHSMGARVALEMWRSAPERIDRLALFDFWVGPVAVGEPEKRSLMMDLSQEEGMEAVAQSWVASMVHPDRTDDTRLVDPLHKMVCTYSHTQHVGQISALLTRSDLWPLLPTIDVPTLIAVGRQDPWRSVEQHEQMAAAIPGARLEVIEDCGHMAPAEQPEAVTALLVEWLSWL